ncbi:MAG: glycosyltransferase [Patescibacteria group bacterium]
MGKISIIVPVRDERDNLEVLLLRISDTLKKAKQHFEIVAVDDYSTDGSLELLMSLKKTYKELIVVKKQGVIGKGSAILEGVQSSGGEILVTIDADLAYAPEAIPLLLDRLKTCDIAVADRIYVNGERLIKKFLAKSFKLLFGRVIFGLDTDVQSGLKAFKRSVLEQFDLHPKSWSFDLEFLLRAVNAGYMLESVPVEYGSRKKGKGKMNLLSAGIELLLLSIYYWLIPLEPVAITNANKDQHTVAYKGKRFHTYTRLHHRESAIRTITFGQAIFALVVIGFFWTLLLLNWQLAIIGLVSFLSTMYFIDLLFNLFLIVTSLRKNPEIHAKSGDIAARTNWPTYSIICPLYKEWEMIPYFVKAIDELEYPKDKLQVLLTLEEDDVKTREEVAKIELPDYFSVVVVPDASPKTKPKACNYALLYATGEYVVIYDAEDRPDPLQLKKAIIAFDQEGKKVVCLQAKLNFYNIHQNLLTRLFTLEYSLWFDLVLTGLHSIGAPIPLGGTSNHFRKESLHLLEGWDPFNVTEDCDLGIRLFKYGYKTRVLDSTTYEEANSRFFSWFGQRSRWIKGYIQTYLVHMRRPHEFISDWGNPHLLTFQLVVGGKVVSMWINPFLWLLTILYFGFRSTFGAFVESLYLTPVFYMAAVSLVFGNFLYFYYYMIGAAKREQWDLVKYAFFIPFYWLMMSVASWIAFNQVLFNPHYWSKTQHGLHLKKQKTVMS